MFDRETLKWFVRGFGLMVVLFVVAAVVVTPQWSRAQNGGNGGQDFGEVSENFSLERTDDPAGRINLPAPEPTGEATNEDPGGEPSEVLTAGEAEAREGALRAAGDVEGQGYSSPLVIPAADFTNDGDTPSSFYFTFSGGYLTGTGAHTCHQAPVYLPNGATIDEVYASIVDDDPIKYLYIRLLRVSNFTGTATELGYLATTPAADSSSVVTISDYSIASPGVIYPDYTYYVGACLENAQTRLYSVRIYYH